MKLFEIFKKKKPKPYSLGWVNVYKHPNGKARYSCHTYKSRRQALYMKPPYTQLEYIDTIEIFTY